MKKIILIILGLIICSNSLAESKSLYKMPWGSKLPKDVASGSLWGKAVGDTMNKHQIQIVNAEDGHPVKSGTQSIRFEIREGDCSHSSGWSDCTGDRYRSELTSTKKGFRHKKFFAWSIYLPEDFQSVDPVKVAAGQIHQYDAGPTKRDLNGMIGWSQNLQFMINNGGYWAVRYLKTFPQESDSYSGYFKKNAHLIDIEDMLGKWTDVVLEFKGSKKTNGIVRVWINGELKYEYIGQTNDGGTNFFKFGLYQTRVSHINYTPPKPWIDGTTKNKADPYPTQVVYYDDVRTYGKSYDKVTESFNKSN